jgi:hypothetical protein
MPTARASAQDAIDVGFDGPVDPVVHEEGDGFTAKEAVSERLDASEPHAVSSSS